MSAAPQAEQLHPDTGPAAETQLLTWQRHQAVADAAWNEAIARTAILQPEGNEDPAPLDQATIDLYDEARVHLKASIFLGPDGPTDPSNLLKLGGSQAAIAEATAVGVFEDGDQLVDTRSMLKDAARHNLRTAAAMIMGDENHPALTLVETIDDADAAGIKEVVTEVAESASNEGDSDAESMRRVAAKAVGQLTGEHELPWQEFQAA